MTPIEIYNILSKLLDLSVAVVVLLGIIWRLNSNKSTITVDDFVDELEQQVKENEKLRIENAKLDIELKVWKRHHERLGKSKRT